MPIQNHTSHAANERTFLAWVRTSLAVIGFGFLVERFDLFVADVAPRSEHIAGARSEFGHVAGLTLIVLGMAMIGVAAWRFARTAREIDGGGLSRRRIARRSRARGAADPAVRGLAVLSLPRAVGERLTAACKRPRT
jgi:putative membrane protein